MKRGGKERRIEEKGRTIGELEGEEEERGEGGGGQKRGNQGRKDRGRAKA